MEYEDLTPLAIGQANVIVRRIGEDGAMPGFDVDHIEIECTTDAGSVHLGGTPSEVAAFISNLSQALAVVTA